MGSNDNVLKTPDATRDITSWCTKVYKFMLLLTSSGRVQLIPSLPPLSIVIVSMLFPIWEWENSMLLWFKFAFIWLLMRLNPFKRLFATCTSSMNCLLFSTSFGFSFFISQLGLMILAINFELLQEKKKKRTANVPRHEFQKTSD